MRTAEQLVAAVDAARRELQAAIGEAGATEDTKVADGWTLKEMLAHVAFWEEAPIGWIAMAIRQSTLPEGWRFGSGYYPEGDWPHFEVHNAREAAWGREQAMDAVLERWDRAHRALLDLLATVTPEELAAHGAYFDEHAHHLRQHAADLRAATAGPA